MVKCEKCGNTQPGDKIDVCRKNDCGYVCHPVKAGRPRVAPVKVEVPDGVEMRPTFGGTE